MKTTILIFAFLICVCSNVMAQNTSNQTHPIDSMLHECLKFNASSFGSIECQIQRYNRWSQELDQVYDELMARMNNQERKILIEQQIAWAKYRDLQFKMNEKFYGKRGSIWMPFIAAAKGDLVRDRVLVLQSYLDLLNSERK